MRVFYWAGLLASWMFIAVVTYSAVFTVNRASVKPLTHVGMGSAR
jgi:hypothetical protein